MKYILEVRNSNPSILERQEDGTYLSIAHGNGEQSISSLMRMLADANEVH